MKPGRGFCITGGQTQDVVAHGRDRGVEQLLKHGQVLMNTLKGVAGAEQVIALYEHVPHLPQMDQHGIDMCPRKVLVTDRSSFSTARTKRKCGSSSGEEESATVHGCTFLSEKELLCMETSSIWLRPQR